MSILETSAGQRVSHLKGNAHGPPKGEPTRMVVEALSSAPEAKLHEI